MFSRRSLLGMGLAALSAYATSSVQAAEPTLITIRVADMHCATCARKIAGRLVTVPGVLQAKANPTTNIATVTPQKTKAPSPKALWEAVEKAGFKPLKIEGPLGTFEQKPSA